MTFDPKMKSARIMQEYEQLKDAVTQCIDLRDDESVTHVEYCRQSNVFTAVVATDMWLDNIQVDGITVETKLREIDERTRNS
ncbi:hypothetical protein VPHK567_0204 [Vibrio phage K567]